MGHERRLMVPRSAAVLGLLLALNCAASGCQKRESEERQRQLLTPSKAHREARMKPPGPPPLFDAKGNLLPSDKKVGEIVLPVGLELRNQHGNEWRFNTDRVHWEAVASFFEKQLVSMNTKRLVGAVSFGNAAPKTDPYAKQRYTVEVEELTNARTASRVLIRMEEEAPRPLKPAEADAKLEALRKNAI